MNILVNMSRGPHGKNGFRTGWFPFEINGEKKEIYSSIPHAMLLDQQRERLVDDIEKWASGGHGQVRDGK